MRVLAAVDVRKLTKERPVARIAGINIPTKKRVEIALTYIHGIGTTSARTICSKAGITQERRINDLTEDELSKLRDIIDAD